MHKFAAAALSALALLLAAPSAFAAQSFTIDSGQFPDVAVDSTGAAHIVWEVHDPAPVGDAIGYCQIPKGGTACGRQTVIDAPADGIGRSSYVFAPTPNRIIVVTHRCCSPDATLAYISNDNGNTFADPVTIGNLDFEGNAVLGPGDAIYAVDNGGSFQRMPLSGPQVTQQAALNAGFPVPTFSSLALDGGVPLKVSADGANTTFHRQSGAGDPNDASTWAGPTPVTPPLDEPHLASGSAGLAMIGRTQDGNLVARKWNGSGFDTNATLSTSDPIQADLTTDSSGRFTAAWLENGASPNEIRIATSSDGVTWSKPSVVLRGTGVDDLFHTQVATGSDGQGFAVFDANSRLGNVTVTPLSPTLPLSGGGGSAGTPIATTTVGDQQISFFGPTACVQPPEKVTLRVTSKRKKKLSPNKRVKITQVVFNVDKKKVKDKKAAFKAAFSTAAMPRGSFHKVGAVVTLKPVKGGKAKKKTLKGRFNVCG